MTYSMIAERENEVKVGKLDPSKSRLVDLKSGHLQRRVPHSRLLVSKLNYFSSRRFFR
jgi:hypothetical protein